MRGRAAARVGDVGEAPHMAAIRRIGGADLEDGAVRPRPEGDEGRRAGPPRLSIWVCGAGPPPNSPACSCQATMASMVRPGTARPGGRPSSSVARWFTTASRRSGSIIMMPWPTCATTASSCARDRRSRRRTCATVRQMARITGSGSRRWRAARRRSSRGCASAASTEVPTLTTSGWPAPGGGEEPLDAVERAAPAACWSRGAGADGGEVSSETVAPGSDAPSGAPSSAAAPGPGRGPRRQAHQADPPSCRSGRR